MAEKLIIEQDKWSWRIVWEQEDGSTDGHLGDARKGFLRKPPPADREDAECWHAEKEALAIYNEARKARDGSVFRDSGGFAWESQQDAKSALRRIKTAIRIGLDKRPWPPWAKEALRAGWKPPKGWKP